MRSVLLNTAIFQSVIRVSPTLAGYTLGSHDKQVDLLTDVSKISQYWGQISPYFDNPENYFGVGDVGLPLGCQVEQAHLLQRHANRFPTGKIPGLVECFN